MSHRALVAVARSDGRYDVFRARQDVDDQLLADLARPGARLPAGFRDEEPSPRGVTLGRVLADHLDPIEHEALLFVEPDGRVRPFVVVPYLLATAEGLIGGDPAGAAVELSDRDGGWLSPTYLRGWRHGTTEALGEAVDCDLVPPEEAFAWLDAAVHRLAGDRRRVLDVPGRG